MEPGISGMIGLLLGGVMAWLALRSRTASLQAQLSLREKELSAVKADLARLLEDQRALVESRARLESALESERKTSNEKIELLTKSSDRAAEDLQNAFKALAADALKSNNSSFLQIAQETLKRFQSEAKGDLEAKQKAVADLVAPVREYSQQGGCPDPADGKRANGCIRRTAATSRVSDHEPEGIAVGDGKLGARVTDAERPRTLGRDPVAARGRDRRDALLLRFRRAGNNHGREWPAASGSGGEAAGRKTGSGRRENSAAGFSGCI